MKEIDTFIQMNLNKHVDYDGHFGAQCVDLARAYFDYQDLPQFPPVVGAKDIADQLRDRSDVKEVSHPKKGDILIWGSNEYNPYGHVAIAISDVANEYVGVIEQNGLHPGGSAYTRARAVDSASNFIGAFRIC
jgi:hypothetical protein